MCLSHLDAVSPLGNQAPGKTERNGLGKPVELETGVVPPAAGKRITGAETRVYRGAGVATRASGLASRGARVATRESRSGCREPKKWCMAAETGRCGRER